MNKDINVEVCKCGTIHVIQPEKFHTAIGSGSNYLKVCRNCGATTVIGIFEDDDGSETFYDVELPDDRCSITLDDFDLTNGKKPFSEIYFSHGYKIPMMSGGYATCFQNNSFQDTSSTTTYKDESLTVKLDALSKCVDMDRLIKEIPDEILYALSKLRISGINWANTKYYGRYGLVPNDLPYMAPYELRKFRIDITPEDYSKVVNSF